MNADPAEMPGGSGEENANDFAEKDLQTLRQLLNRRVISNNIAFTEEKRLQIHQRLVDLQTFRRIARLGTKPGWRCLEVGAGEGSVAQWLAEKVGPQGCVVATDIDTRLLDNKQGPHLEVRSHDILVDDLEPGYYDLVHTRALLMHLPDPEQAVKKMAAAVRPGGWLLLEDFDWTCFGAIETESPAAQVFNQKMETLAKALQAAHVTNLYLGRHLRRLLEQLEFVDIGNEGTTNISRGGDPLFTQAQQMSLQLAGPALIAAGVLTEQEVELLQRLLADPAFHYVNPIFFGAWGRRSQLPEFADVPNQL